MSVNGFHHYCVTVRDGDTVKHYRIRQLDEGGFFIARRVTFRTLSELVDHYSTDADGLCVNLRKPCSQVSWTFKSSLLHCFRFFPFFLAPFYDLFINTLEIPVYDADVFWYYMTCSHGMDRHYVIVLYVHMMVTWTYIVLLYSHDMERHFVWSQFLPSFFLSFSLV